MLFTYHSLGAKYLFTDAKAGTYNAIKNIGVA